MIIRLILTDADPTRSFFRSVDQFLPTPKCRILSALETSLISHIGLGQRDVFSMVKVDRVGSGVERRGDERGRAGALNDDSAGGAVYYSITGG